MPSRNKLHTLIREVAYYGVAGPCLNLGLVPSSSHRISRVFNLALSNRDAGFLIDTQLRTVIVRDVWNTTFSMSVATCIWLWRKLWRLRPGYILDMGGGRTAALLSLFAKERAKRGESCLVISLDESHDWLARTKAELAQLELEDFCRLLYCPVRGEDVTSHGYDLISVFGTAVEERAKFDFVVIDGPSGGWGRRNTFPSALPYLAKQAHVVIDDADRVLERESIEIWLSNYAKFIRRAKFLPLPHGAAILTVDKE